MSAVAPSSDIAKLAPKLPCPLSPAALSSGPCCVQVLPERANVQAPPTLVLASLAPISAVPPSADSAVLVPKLPEKVWFGVSVDPCWVQEVPERANTEAVPAPGLPMSAVAPSKSRATLEPKSALPWVPVSFGPCCAHVLAER